MSAVRLKLSRVVTIRTELPQIGGLNKVNIIICRKKTEAVQGNVEKKLPLCFWVKQKDAFMLSVTAATF